MKIEHVAYQVPDPAAAADWYVRHFDFEIKRSADQPVPVRYVADSSGTVMIEIYNNPKAPIPDYASMDPLVLHLAFKSEDVAGDRQRLIEAGATPVGEITDVRGDQLAMLRDPWGVPIQLCKRAEPMV